MKQTPSIFTIEKTVYEADTCQPLVAAATAGQVRMQALAHGTYPGKPLKKNLLPGLSSIGYWDTSTDQNWGLDWHRNEGIEICCLDSGKLSFSIEQEHKTYTLMPGNITITHPWQPHRLGNPDITPSRLYWLIMDVNVRRPNQNWDWPKWIILTPDDISELTRILCDIKEPVWTCGPEVRQCFQKIGSILDADNSHQQISLLSILINELFILLLSMFRGQNITPGSAISVSQKTVELFLQDIRTNQEVIAHPWTLERMAKQCGLGKTRFRYYCKQLTNMLPMEYLTHCRTERAADMLLMHQDISITDIALACGFGTSQYFSSVFQKCKKCSPRQYRQSQDKKTKNHPG